GESGPPELCQDKTLPEKLKAEAEGILAWIVSGCREWLQSGLNMPPEVKAATESYRAEHDQLGQFIADTCITTPAARVRANQLYAAYQRWCEGIGERPVPSKAFSASLEARKFEKRSSNGTWYLGIALRADVEVTEGNS